MITKDDVSFTIKQVFSNDWDSIGIEVIGQYKGFVESESFYDIKESTGVPRSQEWTMDHVVRLRAIVLNKLNGKPSET